MTARLEGDGRDVPPGDRDAVHYPRPFRSQRPARMAGTVVTLSSQGHIPARLRALVGTFAENR